MDENLEICQNCKKTIPKNATFCPHCGLKLKTSIMDKKFSRICNNCNTIIKTSKLTYCPICNSDLRSKRRLKA